MEEKEFPKWSKEYSKKQLFRMFCQVEGLEKIMHEEGDLQENWFLVTMNEAYDLIREEGGNKEKILHCYKSLKDFKERYKSYLE